MKGFILFTVSLFICVGLLVINKETGYFNIPFFNVPSGHVRADFINKSSETIQDITTFKGVSSHGISNLESNATKPLFIKYTGGEGILDFSITFQSGKKLSCTDVYIERGYHLTYTIYSDSVHIAY
ncbi:MAG: hypothetical protein ACI976_002369 [Aureispira sp.]|jgi:hypothetical protein